MDKFENISWITKSVEKNCVEAEKNGTKKTTAREKHVGMTTIAGAIKK